MRRNRLNLMKWLLIISIGLGVYTYFTLPDVGQLKGHYPKVLFPPGGDTVNVVFVKQRPRGWISLGQIPRHTMGAFIVSEDYSFFQHDGFDEAEFSLMLKEAAFQGKKLRGASTITQQVAKNVFLNHNRSVLRKGREFFVAKDLEENFSKSKILEIYFNVVELGDGLFGINAASQYYFEKDPRKLNPKESAFLAMLLPNPRSYSQSFRKRRMTRYATKRVNNIMAKMAHADYITDRQRDRFADKQLPFERRGYRTLTPSPREGYHSSILIMIKDLIFMAFGLDG